MPPISDHIKAAITINLTQILTFASNFSSNNASKIMISCHRKGGILYVDMRIRTSARSLTIRTFCNPMRPTTCSRKLQRLFMDSNRVTFQPKKQKSNHIVEKYTTILSPFKNLELMIITRASNGQNYSRKPCSTPNINNAQIIKRTPTTQQIRVPNGLDNRQRILHVPLHHLIFFLHRRKIHFLQPDTSISYKLKLKMRWK